jgi:hypothetical protein
MTWKWEGPLTIGDLLDQVVAKYPVMPPPARSVYLVSKKAWKGKPDSSCEPLYVGGNTSESERFRTRVGDLIADMFGFYSNETGHHSGGITLNEYCAKARINPKDLYIGWLKKCDCGRYAECTIFEELRPKFWKKKPARCKQHSRHPTN